MRILRTLRDLAEKRRQRCPDCGGWFCATCVDGDVHECLGACSYCSVQAYAFDALLAKCSDCGGWFCPAHADRDDHKCGKVTTVAREHKNLFGRLASIPFWDLAVAALAMIGAFTVSACVVYWVCGLILT